MSAKSSLKRGVAVVAAMAGAIACSSQRPATSPAILRPASAVESIDPWEFEGTSGRVIRTHSYRLFTTEKETDLRLMMPDFLELALAHYTTALATLPHPDLKLDTFLMADRSQWASLTRQVMGEQAAPYLRIQRGGFASGGRALLFAIGHRDTLAIAAHEGWHQYTQRTFRQELPLWLEEGVAAYMEGFIANPEHPELPIFKGWANPERFEQLVAAAKSGRLKPLARVLEMGTSELLNADTDDALTYYAQVWALVHFLKEGRGGTRSEALSRALTDAASGHLRERIDQKLGSGASQLLARERRGPETLTAYFDTDIAVAAREYEEFVAAIVSRVSKDRIVAGLSPLAP